MATGKETGSRGPAGYGTPLTCTFLSSLALSGAVVATAWGASSHLGAPAYWPWLLTALQVLGLWSAGSNRWWGWLLGAAVQPPWIAYAVVTAQFGFIPGCAVSAAVQTYGFLRRSSSMERRNVRSRRAELYA